MTGFPDRLHPRAIADVQRMSRRFHAKPFVCSPRLPLEAPPPDQLVPRETPCRSTPLGHPRVKAVLATHQVSRGTRPLVASLRRTSSAPSPEKSRGALGAGILRHERQQVFRPLNASSSVGGDAGSSPTPGSTGNVCMQRIRHASFARSAPCSRLVRSSAVSNP
jgi:hypothetical protein